MSDPLSWKSFRELDEQWQSRKGTAFLAFKQHLPQLREGHDFVYLNHQAEQQLIEQLRAANRIYNSSVNVVLLAPGAIRILDDHRPR